MWIHRCIQSINVSQHRHFQADYRTTRGLALRGISPHGATGTRTPGHAGSPGRHTDTHNGMLAMYVGTTRQHMPESTYLSLVQTDRIPRLQPHTGNKAGGQTRQLWSARPSQIWGPDLHRLVNYPPRLGHMAELLLDTVTFSVTVTTIIQYYSAEV